MKALFTTTILALLIATATTVRAQDWREDYLGLPGDNLNLYATMKLFQESETLEGFERALNSEDSGINNLDLNGDNLVDYIMVTDYVDGNVHNIVLSVALNKKHRQDVAVFTVERFRNGSVQVQLVGDEDLYGPNYIIEPWYDNNYAETANPGYYGKPAGKVHVTVVVTSAWDIAAWPLVRHIYYPGYLAWHSPWTWGYRPAYYIAWHPWYWHYYYGYHSHWHHHYYAHFRPWHHVRYHRYHDFYYAGVRHWSKDVHRNISRGTYRETYSRPELQNEGMALHTRIATEASRTRVSASGEGRLSREVPEAARVRATSATAARRPDASVTVRTRPETEAIRNESGVTRREAGATPPQAVETSRRSAPAAGGTTTARPAATRPEGTREASPAVSGESRSRMSGASASEESGKSATRPSTINRSDISTRNPVNTRSSSEITSDSRTRNEPAPRTSATVRQETTGGSSSSSRVSTRSSSTSESSGSTKVATRPSNSGNSSQSRSSSSSGSSSRSSTGSNDSSSGRSRR